MLDIHDVDPALKVELCWRPKGNGQWHLSVTGEIYRLPCLLRTRRAHDPYLVESLRNGAKIDWGVRLTFADVPTVLSADDIAALFAKFPPPARYDDGRKPVLAAMGA